MRRQQKHKARLKRRNAERKAKAADKPAAAPKKK